MNTDYALCTDGTYHLFFLRKIKKKILLDTELWWANVAFKEAKYITFYPYAFKNVTNYLSAVLFNLNFDR